MTRHTADREQVAKNQPLGASPRFPPNDDIEGTGVDAKHEIRKSIRSLRRQVGDRDEQEHRILERLLSSDAFSAAVTVLAYVGVRDEVRTDGLLTQFLGPRGASLPADITTWNSRRLALPWCCDDRLRLCEVRSWQELLPGQFGIPEPTEEVRDQSIRSLDQSQIDLAILPAVAFDRNGGRLGSGRGFYDRLLPALRPDCLKIGLAFDVQLIERVPLDELDMPVDVVLTAAECIRCSPKAETF